MFRQDVEAGYPATRATLELLAETVRERHSHPRMRERMRHLLRSVGRADFDAIVAVVWQWVTMKIRYLRDPIGAEHVTDPVELDRQVDDGDAAFEDCESIALYAATLLASVGVPSLFEAQGRDPDRPKSFRHCSLQVLNSSTGEAISFDPVGAHYYPGVFGLGDTMHREGDPVELWNLDGERIDMRRVRRSLRNELLGDVDFGQQFQQVLQVAAPFLSPILGSKVAAFAQGGAIPANQVAVGPGGTIHDIAGKIIGTTLALTPKKPAVSTGAVLGVGAGLAALLALSGAR